MKIGKTEYFSALGKKFKPTVNEKMILNPHNQESKTSIIQKSLNTFVKTCYNYYKRDFDFQVEREKSKAHQNLQSHKKREHELITIGALTDLVKFPKDWGIITGTLLYVLDSKIKENPNFEHQLKISGDELLRGREMEKS